MPEALVWSRQRDDTLCALRARGRSWEAIAVALGISRWAVIERAKAIGAHTPLPPRPPQEPDEADRPPLPAGHPLAWAVLTAGTLLDGTPYPGAATPAAASAGEADGEGRPLLLERAA